MRLNDISWLAFQQLFGRLWRRALGFALLALFALIALYHFTVAGTLALEAHYGLLQARLIVAGLYTFAVVVTVLILWLTRVKPLPKPQPEQAALSSPRGMQLTMLVEAVLLGYSLARRTPNQR